MSKEEILGTGKKLKTTTGEVEMYLKEHCWVAMDEYYNQAIGDAIKIITDMQGWVVDNGDERFLSTHKENLISKLQALKK